MFERFTRPARLAVINAQEEARRLEHRTIGSEHLLLALSTGEQNDPARATLTEFGATHQAVEARLVAMIGGAGFDADALASMGVDLDEIRRRVEAQFGPGALDEEVPPGKRRWPRLRGWAEGGGAMPFGDDAKMSLELALREAIALRHREIGTGHILLGLLRSPGLGVRVLAALGVESAPLRSQLMLRMRTSA